MANNDPALHALTTYCGSPGATARELARRIDRLDRRQRHALALGPDPFLPTPAPGRSPSGLAQGDGDDSWFVVWWDSYGNRVVGKVIASGDWYALDEPDE